MASLAQIYDWFMTSKKPTQAQFWASWGSFWNKLEQIPISAIAGLSGILNAKAEKLQFDSHLTDNNAHASLFAKTRFIPVGEFLIFKTDVEQPNELLQGMVVKGIVENCLIEGIYQGGSSELLTSFEIFTSQEL